MFFGEAEGLRLAAHRYDGSMTAAVFKNAWYSCRRPHREKPPPGVVCELLFATHTELTNSSGLHQTG